MDSTTTILERLINETQESEVALRLYTQNLNDKIKDLNDYLISSNLREKLGQFKDYPSEKLKLLELIDDPKALDLVEAFLQEVKNDIERKVQELNEDYQNI